MVIMAIMAIMVMVVLYCIILLHGTKGIRYSAKQSKDGTGCKCAALRISGCRCGCQHPRFHQKMCVCTFMLCCADRFLWVWRTWGVGEGLIVLKGN